MDFHRNLAIFLVILVAISTFGNPVTIYIFCRQKLTPSTLLFMVLAVLDFLLLLLSLFTTALPNLVTDSPSFSDAGIFLTAYVVPVLIIIYCMSTWLVVVMALNRYLAVTKPLLYNRITKIRFVCVQLVILFVLSVIFTIPRFLEVEVHRLEPAVEGHHYYSSFSDLYLNKHYQPYYRIVSYFILLNVLPLTLLIFFTYKLVKELRRANERRQELSQGQNANQPYIASNRITFILTTVVVVFIVFHTPVFVYRLMELIFFLKDEEWGCMDLDITLYGISRVCNMCVQINATFNFIIYIISSPPFRKDLMKMFCFRVTTCENSSSSGTCTINGHRSNTNPTIREDNTSASNASIIQLMKYSHKNFAFSGDDSQNNPEASREVPTEMSIDEHQSSQNIPEISNTVPTETSIKEDVES